MAALDRNAVALFDYAVAHPEGFTNRDAMAELGWNLGTFNDAARAIRLASAEDSINLVCDPQGWNAPWLYRLVGTYDAAKGWATNRLTDTEKRLETIESVAHALVNATDGRSIDGRKARLIHSTTRYLREQLVNLGQ